MTVWAVDTSIWDAVTIVAGKVVYKPVDWVKTGLDMAIVKVAEGVWEDPAFKIQWAAAKGVMPRIAYHFFRSNQNAIAQAEFVKSILADDFDRSTDFIALDFETADGVPPDRRLAAVGSWLYEVEKFGTLPFIYTRASFWLDAGGAQAVWARKYPLWLAAWPLDNWIARMKLPPYIFKVEKLAKFKADIVAGKYKPSIPRPWSECAIWQFTARADTRAVPGHPAVKKVCDYNAVFMLLPAIPDAPPVKPPVRERKCPFEQCPLDKL
uniref:Putative glycoside hydrolase n=1 Tax=viral metagenome TaxID=1070528 RepID=A0A6H1ZAM3_9ZZZZ